MKRILPFLCYLALLCSQAQATIGMNGLTSGCSTTDATSFTTSSFTPSANTVVFAITLATRTIDSVDLPSLTGNSMTWESSRQVSFNTSGTPTQRLGIFQAMNAAPGAGTLTIDYGETVLNACWSVFQFTGVTNGSDVVVQGNSDQGATGTTATVGLSAFADATNNVGLFCVALNSVQDITPGSGWTQIHDVNTTTPDQSLFTEWRTGEDLNPSASWSTTSVKAYAGFEIKMMTVGLGTKIIPLLSDDED